MVSGRQDSSAHRLRIQGFRGAEPSAFPTCSSATCWRVSGGSRSPAPVEQALCRSRSIVGIYNTGLGNTQIAEALAHRREGDVCWITAGVTTHPAAAGEGGPALTLDQNTRQHAQLAIDLMLRHLESGYQRKPMPTVKSTLSSGIAENVD